MDVLTAELKDGRSFLQQHIHLAEGLRASTCRDACIHWFESVELRGRACARACHTQMRCSEYVFSWIHTVSHMVWDASAQGFTEERACGGRLASVAWLYTDPQVFIPAWGRVLVLKWKFECFWHLCSPFNYPLAPHRKPWRTLTRTATGTWMRMNTSVNFGQNVDLNTPPQPLKQLLSSHTWVHVDSDSLHFYCFWTWIDVETRVWTMSLWLRVPETLCRTVASQQMATETFYYK